MSDTLILRPNPEGGELAYQISMKEAEELVEKGEAERTFDGLFREVAKPDKATKKTAKKAEYSTKDMKAED